MDFSHCHWMRNKLFWVVKKRKSCLLCIWQSR